MKPSRISVSLPASFARSTDIVIPQAATPLGLEGTHQRRYEPPTCVQIGSRWREIQGANNWEGLLQPKLDDCLRSELIRYGQFAQVAYDAFDFDKYSQYCGSCLYSKHNLFNDVNLHNTGYTVTRYIYATADVDAESLLMKSERPDAWSTKSNWIGYIAVCTDKREIERLGRRDIMIVWRGTITNLEKTADMQSQLTPCSSVFDETKHDESSHIRVEAGFQNLYTSKDEDSRFNKNSAQEWMLMGLKDAIDEYKSGHELSFTICGHSLGSALGILNAYDLAVMELNQVEVGGRKVTVPITVFSYGGPRVGNHYFKERVEQLGIKVLRVVNVGDVVPLVPGLVLNMLPHVPEAMHCMVPHVIKETRTAKYKHVGVELTVDDSKSHHLNHEKALTLAQKVKVEGLNFLSNALSSEQHDGGTVFCLQHDLEVYMHLIDGYGRYGVPPSRDPVLVNKFCGFLKDDKYVPENWWKLKNKGSIMKYSEKENRYYQPDRLVEDVPVPPSLQVVAEATAFKKMISIKSSNKNVL